MRSQTSMPYFENFKSIQVHLLNCHSAQGHSARSCRIYFQISPGFRGSAFWFKNDHGVILKYRPIGD